MRREKFPASNWLIVTLALCPAGAFAAVDYRIERIASGLNQPTYVTQAPGDPSNILYYTTRTTAAIPGFSANNTMGAVYRYDTTTRTSTLVLSLAGRNVTQDTGLSTIAFSPQFNDPGTPGYQKIFVASSTAVTLTATSGGPINRVEEYTVPSNGGPAVFDQTVLQYNNGGNAFNNHTIDWIGFDPTATGAAVNYLYISEGDGHFSLPNRPSQNPNDVEGKILRVDVSGPDAYPSDPNKNFAIPASNPLPAYNAAHPSAPISGVGEVYVTGLRNPDRVSFDRANGNMYIGDVGESTTEEVDFLKAGSNTAGPPVDFGWPQREGTSPSTGNVSTTRTMVNPYTGVTSLNPIAEFNHSGSAGNAVIGGYVYRGPIASLQGQYFYSDFVVGQNYDLSGFDPNSDPSTFDGANGTVTNVTTLWNSLVFDPTNPSYVPGSSAQFGITHPVSYGEDNSGNVYIVDLGGNAGDASFSDSGGEYPGAGSGEIFELVPVPEPASLSLCAAASLLLLRRRRLDRLK